MISPVVRHPGSIRRARGARSLLAGLLLGLSFAPSARAAGAIETAGDVLELVLPAAATTTTLGHRDRRGTQQFAAAAALTLGTTYGLKYSDAERRPNGGKHSFPSGHSSISFCSAEFLRRRYGPAYGAPAYALAAFVAYSRVEAKAHYVHDVIAGAALGMISSYLLARPFHDHRLGIAAGGDGRSAWWIRVGTVGNPGGPQSD
jgi:membrane-associated phospholipid phosphatase